MPAEVDPVTTSPPFHLSVFSDTALRYARVERRGDEPTPEEGTVDVAVLDMHHRYPNLGHYSIVETLLGVARRERHRLGRRAPALRVISYDVRGAGAVPARAARFPVIVGTGGPGAIDPRMNDGVADWSQGIHEDPSWEAPLFRLFDEILSDNRTAFLGICHSFGLLAHWAGVAEPVLRGHAKGGKSTGVVKNVLTDEARSHPWFSGLFQDASGHVIEVLDSRLFDLIPTGHGRAKLLAFEARNGSGEPGEAVTMMELARDADGISPRVWAVNHHPEIGDKGQQRDCMNRLVARGEVTPAWVAERELALRAWNHSAATEKCLQRTSAYTFERPVRRLIARAMETGGGEAALPT